MRRSVLSKRTFLRFIIRTIFFTSFIITRYTRDISFRINISSIRSIHVFLTIRNFKARTFCSITQTTFYVSIRTDLGMFRSILTLVLHRIPLGTLRNHLTRDVSSVVSFTFSWSVLGICAFWDLKGRTFDIITLNTINISLLINLTSNRSIERIRLTLRNLEVYTISRITRNTVNITKFIRFSEFWSVLEPKLILLTIWNDKVWAGGGIA